jgi:mono/diheme cytochrome c family protein
MRLLHALSVGLLAMTLAACGNQTVESPSDAHPDHSAAPAMSDAAGPAAANPVTADARSVATGRALYAKNCQSCHGPRGKGDGPAVAKLNVEVPDLTSQDVQSETDGELFTLITKGSKPMPAYRRLLNEEQRWHVVNYLRASFGPQAKPT